MQKKVCELVIYFTIPKLTYVTSNRSVLEMYQPKIWEQSLVKSRQLFLLPTHFLPFITIWPWELTNKDKLPV